MTIFQFENPNHFFPLKQVNYPWEQSKDSLTQLYFSTAVKTTSTNSHRVHLYPRVPPHVTGNTTTSSIPPKGNNRLNYLNFLKNPGITLIVTLHDPTTSTDFSTIPTSDIVDNINQVSLYPDYNDPCFPWQ